MGRSPAADLLTAAPEPAPAPDQADQAELLAIATEAARAAGDLLLERFRRDVGPIRAKSSPTDPVSDADLAAEGAIRELLAVRRPGDAILGEEGGDRGDGGGALRWVVDPLDGTVNFLFGIPQWAVSVACEDARGTLVGVVHDPPRDETFAATRDGPATLAGAPLVPSGRAAQLETALVATGFAYEARVRAAQAPVAARLLPRVRDLRRLGSAALDLAWTAAGRYDAYYERAMKPWDTAAGALVCARAGLALRTLAPAGDLPAGLLVAPEGLIEQLLALVGTPAP